MTSVNSKQNVDFLSFRFAGIKKDRRDQPAAIN